MRGLRYLEEAVTLSLDTEKCTGCGACTVVCPHGVFAIGADKRATIIDRGACMECGACKLNCAWGAIDVKPGVGCAEAIIHSWIYGGEPTCGCSTPGAEGAGSACCGSAPAVAREVAPSGSTQSGAGCGTGAPTPRELTPPGAPTSGCGCGTSTSGGGGQAPGES